MGSRIPTRRSSPRRGPSACPRGWTPCSPSSGSSASCLADTHWGWLAVSIACCLASLWARAVRWRYLFPRTVHPTHLFNAVMIGYMGNNLLPLRAGEVLRVYVVTRRGQPLWTTVTTLVVERALDGLAIGIVLAFVFLRVPTPREFAWA